MDTDMLYLDLKQTYIILVVQHLKPLELFLNLLSRYSLKVNFALKRLLQTQLSQITTLATHCRELNTECIRQKLMQKLTRIK